MFKFSLNLETPFLRFVYISLVPCVTRVFFEDRGEIFFQRETFIWRTIKSQLVRTEVLFNTAGLSLCKLDEQLLYRRSMYYKKFCTKLYRSEILFFITSIWAQIPEAKTLIFILIKLETENSRRSRIHVVRKPSTMFCQRGQSTTNWG